MKLWHVGILCEDIEKTIAFVSKTGEVNPGDWAINEMNFDESCVRQGTGGLLKSTFGTVGGVGFEIIQPMDEKSYQYQALKKCGTGVHHVAYICGDELEAIVANLLAEGGKVVWEAQFGLDHIYYVEQAGGGTVLELINDMHPPV